MTKVGIRSSVGHSLDCTWCINVGGAVTEVDCLHECGSCIPLHFTVNVADKCIPTTNLGSDFHGNRCVFAVPKSHRLFDAVR